MSKQPFIFERMKVLHKVMLILNDTDKFTYNIFLKINPPDA